MAEAVIVAVWQIAYLVVTPWRPTPNTMTFQPLRWLEYNTNAAFARRGRRAPSETRWASSGTHSSGRPRLNPVGWSGPINPMTRCHGAATTDGGLRNRSGLGRGTPSDRPVRFNFHSSPPRPVALSRVFG